MDYDFLAGTELFRGILPRELEAAIGGLKAEQRSYQKGAAVYRAGEQIRSLGMVLSGGVNIESDDIWGNRSILDNIGPGQVFAETYACLCEEPLMVSVVASEDTKVLFLNMNHILQGDPGHDLGKARLIRNLLSITAQKNLSLSRRIFHTASKSIRGRLLSYLSFQSVRQGRLQFSIPFDRQQLADYLGVDRSALSKELGKMQREGLLTVRKNHFCLREDRQNN